MKETIDVKITGGGTWGGRNTASCQEANTFYESETRVPVGRIGDSEFVCVMGGEENRYPVPRNLTYNVNH